MPTIQIPQNEQELWEDIGIFKRNKVTGELVLRDMEGALPGLNDSNLPYVRRNKIGFNDYLYKSIGIEESIRDHSDPRLVLGKDQLPGYWGEPSALGKATGGPIAYAAGNVFGTTALNVAEGTAKFFGFDNTAEYIDDVTENWEANLNKFLFTGDSGEDPVSELKKDFSEGRLLEGIGDLAQLVEVGAVELYMTKGATLPLAALAKSTGFINGLRSTKMATQAMDAAQKSRYIDNTASRLALSAGYAGMTATGTYDALTDNGMDPYSAIGYSVGAALTTAKLEFLGNKFIDWINPHARISMRDYVHGTLTETVTEALQSGTERAWIEVPLNKGFRNLDVGEYMKDMAIGGAIGFGVSGLLGAPAARYGQNIGSVGDRQVSLDDLSSPEKIRAKSELGSLLIHLAGTTSNPNVITPLQLESIDTIAKRWKNVKEIQDLYSNALSLSTNSVLDANEKALVYSSSASSGLPVAEPNIDLDPVRSRIPALAKFSTEVNEGRPVKESAHETLVALKGILDDVGVVDSHTLGLVKDSFIDPILSPTTNHWAQMPVSQRELSHSLISRLAVTSLPSESPVRADILNALSNRLTNDKVVGAQNAANYVAALKESGLPQNIGNNVDQILDQVSKYVGGLRAISGFTLDGESKGRVDFLRSSLIDRLDSLNEGQRLHGESGNKLRTAIDLLNDFLPSSTAPSGVYSSAAVADFRKNLGKITNDTRAKINNEFGLLRAMYEEMTSQEDKNAPLIPGVVSQNDLASAISDPNVVAVALRALPALTAQEAVTFSQILALYQSGQPIDMSVIPAIDWNAAEQAISNILSTELKTQTESMSKEFLAQNGFNDSISQNMNASPQENADKVGQVQSNVTKLRGEVRRFWDQYKAVKENLLQSDPNASTKGLFASMMQKNPVINDLFELNQIVDEATSDMFDGVINDAVVLYEELKHRVAGTDEKFSPTDIEEIAEYTGHILHHIVNITGGVPTDKADRATKVAVLNRLIKMGLLARKRNFGPQREIFFRLSSQDDRAPYLHEAIEILASRYGRPDNLPMDKFNKWLDTTTWSMFQSDTSDRNDDPTGNFDPNKVISDEFDGHEWAAHGFTTDLKMNEMLRDAFSYGTKKKREALRSKAAQEGRHPTFPETIAARRLTTDEIKQAATEIYAERAKISENLKNRGITDVEDLVKSYLTKVAFGETGDDYNAIVAHAQKNGVALPTPEELADEAFGAYDRDMRPNRFGESKSPYMTHEIPFEENEYNGVENLIYFAHHSIHESGWKDYGKMRKGKRVLNGLALTALRTRPSGEAYALQSDFEARTGKPLEQEKVLMAMYDSQRAGMMLRRMFRRAQSESPEYKERLLNFIKKMNQMVRVVATDQYNPKQVGKRAHLFFELVTADEEGTGGRVVNPSEELRDVRTSELPENPVIDTRIGPGHANYQELVGADRTPKGGGIQGEREKRRNRRSLLEAARTAAQPGSQRGIEQEAAIAYWQAKKKARDLAVEFYALTLDAGYPWPEKSVSPEIVERIKNLDIERVGIPDVESRRALSYMTKMMDSFNSAINYSTNPSSLAMSMLRAGYSAAETRAALFLIKQLAKTYTKTTGLSSIEMYRKAAAFVAARTVGEHEGATGVHSRKTIAGSNTNDVLDSMRTTFSSWIALFGEDPKHLSGNPTVLIHEMVHGLYLSGILSEMLGSNAKAVEDFVRQKYPKFDITGKLNLKNPGMRDKLGEEAFNYMIQSVIFSSDVTPKWAPMHKSLKTMHTWFYEALKDKWQSGSMEYPTGTGGVDFFTQNIPPQVRDSILGLFEIKPYAARRLAHATNDHILFTAASALAHRLQLHSDIPADIFFSQKFADIDNIEKFSTESQVAAGKARILSRISPVDIVSEKDLLLLAGSDIRDPEAKKMLIEWHKDMIKENLAAAKATEETKTLMKSLKEIIYPDPNNLDDFSIDDYDDSILNKLEKRIMRVLFHGSPHRFDRFSLKHVGMGEGTQFEGHGIYISERARTGRWYRDTYKDRGGNPSFYVVNLSADDSEIIDITDNILNISDDMITALEDVYSRIATTQHGVSANSFVRNELEKFRYNQTISNAFPDKAKITIIDFIERVLPFTDGGGRMGAKILSESLKKMGYKGFKYENRYTNADQKAGEYYNYVIFDESAIEVVHRESKYPDHISGLSEYRKLAYDELIDLGINNELSSHLVNKNEVESILSTIGEKDRSLRDNVFSVLEKYDLLPSSFYDEDNFDESVLRNDRIEKASATITGSFPPLAGDPIVDTLIDDVGRLLGVLAEPPMVVDQKGKPEGLKARILAYRSVQALSDKWDRMFDSERVVLENMLLERGLTREWFMSQNLGGIFQQAKALVHHGVMVIDGPAYSGNWRVTHESLDSILSQIPDNVIKNVWQYLAANRMESIAKNNAEKLAKYEQEKILADEFGHTPPPKPDLTEVDSRSMGAARILKAALELKYGADGGIVAAYAKRIVSWQNATVLDPLRAAGYLTDDQYADLIRTGEWYMPLVTAAELTEKGTPDKYFADGTKIMIKGLNVATLSAREHPQQEMIRKAMSIHVGMANQTIRNSLLGKIIHHENGERLAPEELERVGMKRAMIEYGHARPRVEEVTEEEFNSIPPGEREVRSSRHDPSKRKYYRRIFNEPVKRTTYHHWYTALPQSEKDKVVSLWRNGEAEYYTLEDGTLKMALDSLHPKDLWFNVGPLAPLFKLIRGSSLITGKLITHSFKFMFGAMQRDLPIGSSRSRIKDPSRTALDKLKAAPAAALDFPKSLLQSAANVFPSLLKEFPNTFDVFKKRAIGMSEQGGYSASLEDNWNYARSMNRPQYKKKGSGSKVSRIAHAVGHDVRESYFANTVKSRENLRAIEMAQAGSMSRLWAKTKVVAKGSGAAAWNILSGTGAALDATTRINERQKAQRLGTGFSDLYMDYLDRTATLDFSRKSEPLRNMNSMFLFMAPMFQDITHMKNILKDPLSRKSFIIKSAIAMTLPAIANYFRWKDDEEWQNLPYWDKFNHLHFWKNRDGSFTKMVWGIGIAGSLFKDLPIAILQTASDRDKDAMNEWISSLSLQTPLGYVPVGQDWRSTAINWVPTGGRPLAQVAMNYDTFSKNPIDYQAGKPGAELAASRDLQHAGYLDVATNKIINSVIPESHELSPRQTSFWITRQFPGLGSDAYIIGNNIITRDVINKWLDNPEVGVDLQTKKNYLPFTSSPAYGAKSLPVNRLFQYSDKARSVKASYDNALKNNQASRAEDLIDKYPELLYYSMLVETSKQVQDLKEERAKFVEQMLRAGNDKDEVYEMALEYYDKPMTILSGSAVDIFDSVKKKTYTKK